jgi:hypothetical protein
MDEDLPLASGKLIPGVKDLCMMILISHGLYLDSNSHQGDLKTLTCSNWLGKSQLVDRFQRINSKNLTVVFDYSMNSLKDNLQYWVPRRKYGRRVLLR